MFKPKVGTPTNCLLSSRSGVRVPFGAPLMVGLA
nr:MAG TPA: hypothetical protein [Bacteriophage sp.]